MRAGDDRQVRFRDVEEPERDADDEREDEARRARLRSLRVAIVDASVSAAAAGSPGGGELSVTALARELLQLGHYPVVFAGPSGRRVVGKRAAEIRTNEGLVELRHASEVWVEIALGDFDVVHVGHAGALPFAEIVQLPTVATVQHGRELTFAEHYGKDAGVAFVASSRRQADLFWEAGFRAIIPPGHDVERYPASGGGEGCAFVGRFSSDEAPHLAIDAARMAQRRIELGGSPEWTDHGFFAREVAPRLGPDVDWLGELRLPARLDLLGRARCLLVPAQAGVGEDGIESAMIEAMLVGTPVIAFADGLALEIVEDGLTGHLVRSVEEMSRRIGDVERLDRSLCRARARSRWGAPRMARAYETLYRETIQRFEAAREVTDVSVDFAGAAVG